MNSLNKFFFSLLILAVLITNLVGERDFIVTLDYGFCTHNLKYFKSSNCSVDHSFDPPRAYLDVHLQRDIENGFAAVQITLQRKKTIRKFLNLKNLNMCDFLTGLPLVPFLGNIRNIIQKFGEMPKQCPIKKEFHFFFKDLVVDAEYLPALTPDGNFSLSISVKCEKELCFDYECGGSIRRK